MCTLNNFVRTKICFVFAVQRNACLPHLYFLFLTWKVKLNPNNSVSVMFDCAWKVSGIHGTNMTDTVVIVSAAVVKRKIVCHIEEIKKREVPIVNGMLLKKFRDEWVFWRCSHVFFVLEFVFIYQVFARLLLPLPAMQLNLFVLTTNLLLFITQLRVQST